MYVENVSTILIALDLEIISGIICKTKIKEARKISSILSTLVV
jgi:hypothetical protein